MKVATSLEVIENLKDQICLLEAELADVRELVPVDGLDEPCAIHNREGCCHVECLWAENHTWIDCDMSEEPEVHCDDDFLDDNLAKHTVGQAWYLRSIGLDVEELAVHCDCVAHLAQCRSGK